MFLLNLPSELIREIILYLNDQDYCFSRLVCRRLRLSPFDHKCRIDAEFAGERNYKNMILIHALNYRFSSMTYCDLQTFLWMQKLFPEEERIIAYASENPFTIQYLTEKFRNLLISDPGILSPKIRNSYLARCYAKAIIKKNEVTDYLKQFELNFVMIIEELLKKGFYTSAKEVWKDMIKEYDDSEALSLLFIEACKRGELEDVKQFYYEYQERFNEFMDMSSLRTAFNFSGKECKEWMIEHLTFFPITKMFFISVCRLGKAEYLDKFKNTNRFEDSLPGISYVNKPVYLWLMNKFNFKFNIYVLFVQSCIHCDLEMMELLYQEDSTLKVDKTVVIEVLYSSSHPENEVIKVKNWLKNKRNRGSIKSWEAMKLRTLVIQGRLRQLKALKQEIKIPLASKTVQKLFALSWRDKKMVTWLSKSFLVKPDGKEICDLLHRSGRHMLAIEISKEFT